MDELPTKILGMRDNPVDDELRRWDKQRRDDAELQRQLDIFRWHMLRNNHDYRPPLCCEVCGRNVSR